MYFEIGVRDFAVARSLDLVVYTGTHEVCQLEDIAGNMVDIYLYDQDRLPVPRYTLSYLAKFKDISTNLQVLLEGHP